MHPESALPGTVSKTAQKSSPVRLGSRGAASTLIREWIADLWRGNKPGFKVEAPHRHLSAAIDWLKRAHDATADGGVANRYSLRPQQYGWWPSYRETTGYIAETFFDVAAKHQDTNAFIRARHMVEWLLEIQNPDGSVSNPSYGPSGIVFDTGQVLFGLVRGYRELHEQKILDSAIDAGRFLVRIQDDDGAWRRHVHRGHPHTYNSRVAWAMLELNTLIDDEEIGAAANRNIQWALEQERDGWFRECAFDPKYAPFTHTIAYAIRGVLEAGALTDNKEYLQVAERCARAVLEQTHDNGFIAGQFDEYGNPRAKYCCLTGNCQLAIIGFRLYELLGDPWFLKRAIKPLEYVMATQDMNHTNPGVRGAIKGSQPLWGSFRSRPIGGYTPLAYPNWATKFFVEALLLMRGIGS